MESTFAGPLLGQFGYQKPKIFSKMVVMIEISTRSQAKQSKVGFPKSESKARQSKVVPINREKAKQSKESKVKAKQGSTPD